MENQFDVINAGGFLYVVDKKIEPKHEELVVFKDEKSTFIDNFLTHVKYSLSYYKIIASNNPALTDLSQLPIVEQDVEQLAAREFEDDDPAYRHITQQLRSTYTKGYKAAQSKKYTEDDIINAFEAGRIDWDGELYKTSKDYLQSLQPVPKAVVLEMESFPTGYFDKNYQVNKPKVDSNNRVIVKKWIY